MIKFFRKIRYDLMEKNKTGKYLKYAIGEILLVVIGILIALQINNKNEIRKDKIREHAVLINLVQNLKSDSISYSRNIKTLTDINSLHMQLYEIGINGKEDIVQENPNLIRRALYYNPITRENDPFIVSKISNDKIKLEILNYFRFMKDMDDSNREFDNIIHDDMREFLRKNGVHNLSSWLENRSKYISEGIVNEVISAEDLISLTNLTEFQQLLFEASLKASDALRTLKMLIDQNEKLKGTIEKELTE